MANQLTPPPTDNDPNTNNVSEQTKKKLSAYITQNTWGALKSWFDLLFQLLKRFTSDNSGMASLNGLPIWDSDIPGHGNLGFFVPPGYIVYIPTVTALGGSFTATAATGKYTIINNFVFFYITVTITTVGTGTYPIVTLPTNVQSNASVMAYGREVASTGVTVSGTQDGANSIFLTTATNGAAASGYVYNVQGFYPAQ